MSTDAEREARERNALVSDLVDLWNEEVDETEHEAMERALAVVERRLVEPLRAELARVTAELAEALKAGAADVERWRASYTECVAGLQEQRARAEAAEARASTAERLLRSVPTMVVAPSQSSPWMKWFYAVSEYFAAAVPATPAAPAPLAGEPGAQKIRNEGAAYVSASSLASQPGIPRTPPVGDGVSPATPPPPSDSPAVPHVHRWVAARRGWRCTVIVAVLRQCDAPAKWECHDDEAGRCPEHEERAAPVEPARVPRAGRFPPQKGDVWRDETRKRNYVFDGAAFVDSYRAAIEGVASGQYLLHAHEFTDGTLTFVRSSVEPAPTGGAGLRAFVGWGVQCDRCLWHSGWIEQKDVAEAMARAHVKAEHLAVAPGGSR